MPIADYKRKALERRRAELLEEYEAANEELSYAPGATDRIRLQRQLEALERDLEEVDRALAEGQAAPPSTPVPPPETAPGYDLAAVRDLLLEAFTAADFRRIFLYTSQPGLRALTNRFGSGAGLADMVDTAIEYCATKAFLPDLLREVEAANPNMYALHASRLRASAAPGGASGEAAKGSPWDPIPLPATKYGTGNSWAVLVGVNTYRDKANYGALKVCVKDVAATRQQLLAGGFDADRVRLLTDDSGELPDRVNVINALQAVANATDQDDLLLFYYSGHGDEAGGESYLVAYDGHLLTLADTAIRVSRIKDIMKAAAARAKVIVLDACHSGADIGGKGPRPMTAAFIQRVFEQAAGLAILSSCTRGEMSYEWQEEEQSVFTHYLLEALQGAADRDDKGFVSVQDTARHVTDGVRLWASQRNASQTPTFECAVAGDIILARYPAPGNG